VVRRLLSEIVGTVVFRETVRPEHSSSSARGPYSLTGASFRMTAHTDLTSAFFLHLLTPVYLTL
jgi:hypothetical protein